MQKRRLGRSGIVVSEICMGTMTFGSYCDEKLSFQILDKCFEMGVNFLDTAEIYPAPPDEKHVFETERIVGKWLETKPRHSIILATKVGGPSHGWFSPPVRNGNAAIDRVHIRKALEGSLKRLRTDYIDLYQIHWPDPEFGYEEILETLTVLAKEGKIRVLGCSNETSWGLMTSLRVAKESQLMRYETIQNNFSFINRRFEDSLSEICKRENISLLPYSPIGGGILTGKYNKHSLEELPKNTRFKLYSNSKNLLQRNMVERFLNYKTLETSEKFIKIADELDVTASQLAVAWSKQHDFVASTIIGCTNVKQIEENLEKCDFKIPEEAIKKLNKISQEIMYPMG